MSKLYKHFPSLFSVLFGILISWILSHPSSPAKKKLPTKSAKNIHFFPNVKIQRKTHYYHLHHWMYLGILYSSLFLIRENFKGKKVIEGFVLGSVLHGLSYRDRFKVKFTPDITT